MEVDLSTQKHKDVDYIEKIYGAIVRYFNENHGTKINTRVVSPLRTPYGNYEQDRCWLKPNNKQYSFDLRLVTEHYTQQYDRNGTAHTAPLPSHFEIVERPANY
jgi:hypothetical protein